MMNQIKSLGWLGIVIAFSGCEKWSSSEASRPSYVDAVLVFNAERQELERLEREKKLAEDEALKQIETIEASIKEAMTDLEAPLKLAGTDPRPKEEVDITEKLAHSARTLAKAFESQKKSVQQQLKQSLAELDRKIEEQRQRVTAAESVRNSIQRPR